jgi:hypothetical protein
MFFVSYLVSSHIWLNLLWFLPIFSMSFYGGWLLGPQKRFPEKKHWGRYKRFKLIFSLCYYYYPLSLAKIPCLTMGGSPFQLNMGKTSNSLHNGSTTCEKFKQNHENWWKHVTWFRLSNFNCKIKFDKIGTLETTLNLQPTHWFPSSIFSVNFTGEIKY